MKKVEVEKEKEKKGNVDETTKEYYKNYYGDYGKELVKPIDEVAPQVKKIEDKPKSKGWEGYTGYKEMDEKKSSKIRISAKLLKIAEAVKGTSLEKEIIDIVRELEE